MSAGPAKALVYYCENGHQIARASRERCPHCDTDVVFPAAARGLEEYGHGVLRVFTLRDRPLPPPVRIPTGDNGLDRVLGGGLSKGSIVLLAGPPGSGKTTIALRTAAYIGRRETTLFCTTEQSEYEIQAAAKRLAANSDNLHLAVTKSVEEVLLVARQLRPRLVVLDSMNGAYTTEATEGDVAQMKAVAGTLGEAAKHKNHGFTLVLIGHITKGGEISGPEFLQHLVDVVLTYTELADGRRVMRSGKNRYGASGEISLYEMTARGLVGSETLVDSLVPFHAVAECGSVGYPCADTARAILIEVTSRVAQEGLVGGAGDRRYSGMPADRMPALLLTLREEAGLDVRGRDVFVNVAHPFGADTADRALDVAVAASVMSSADRLAVPVGTVACGSIGLSGRVDPVLRFEARMQAALSAGFKQVIAPKAQSRLIPKRMQRHPVADVSELRLLIEALGKEREHDNRG